ncbi:class II histone deacetylase [Phaeobacter sp. G2]|jgi:acetoin utilization deacetylase AcuC-like enzyme|nr:class II histone deacetylase [Phaeobacter sp. G2]
MKRNTGYVFHESYLWHNTGTGAALLPSGGPIQPDQPHAENSETKRRIENLLSVSGIKKHLHVFDDITPATRDELCLFHTPEYVDGIKAMSDAGGGDAGELTPFAVGGYEIACLSVGGGLTAGRAILRGEIDNAYVLNRPPGHHAEADIGRGFCIFGNGVVTAKALRREFGLKRIAIVDYDVHHGNGAQKAFYNDPDTMVISMHQIQFYPADSGFVEESGEGAGKGYNINIPLPPGSGHGAYLHAMDTVVVPALERFEPELIIVLSGFDAGGIDPLGRNMAHTDTYREMVGKMQRQAEKHCDGHMLVLHEGGYSAAYAPFCGLAVVETLSGISSGIEDPFLPFLAGMGMQDLQPHQAEMIAQSAELVSGIAPPKVLEKA